ncbi:efflux RND transporter periplasmic adaptor subunit [Thauera linaloolentis]|uniref:RND family efflux transporter MFP subunit n=1 Tax=Thauera linaloolentis (strain DSM 12138 / JCM 21573 / CCUG 41526 / CIP 105981 / IAM 15112 / NBRC 102519 / 47Lol) TaxID=1123367 RepID=N6Y3K9_THAL4|nr:efflux RND transporter periplasmic adaptor subunit [Thauera linaloolentis]ENO88781.1 RND family efflux transporter MFP subunit [Thauera linaloolentis 47Lol = DSM 12138]MCM8564910.1 efflux RND transporter periplasmic adaptor subunit [Thauera linaloolentis]
MIHRYRRWLLAALALAVLAVTLWGFFWRTEDVIETEPLRRGRIEHAVGALGVLQPQRYVDVGAQVSGQIRRIAVQAGDVVAQGDLLLEIDPSVQQATVQADRAALDSLRAQLAEQQAQHDLARLQAQRQLRLIAQDSTRQEDVETAQAELRMAAARLLSLKARIDGARSTLQGNEALLGYTRLYAPMAGTVVTLDAREGQTLNATYQTPKVLRIADLSAMTVRTEVSEADVGKLRPGMPAWFSTLGLVDGAGRPRRWAGTLAQVLPAPAGRAEGEDAPANASRVVSYTALFDVDNADGALLPQMSARVFFVAAAADDVLAVPLGLLEAVEGAPERFTVRVRTAGGVQTRTVRLGVRDRLHGEVLEGLAEGELLVTGITRVSGARRLRW